VSTRSKASSGNGSSARALLSSPTHAVVGSHDLEKLTGQLEHFGFEHRADSVLDATSANALYGIDRELRDRTLAVPGAEHGWVRLIETSEETPTGGAYDSRPIAIDLYTRDFDRSVAMAQEIGAHLLDPVEYALGDLKIREIESVWADDLTVVFLEVNVRRPSVLDHDPERLHSEIHSIVWTVPSIETEMGLFRDSAGLQVLVDAEIRGPIISQLMGLPRPEVPVRFTLYCDDDVAPARLELIEFLEDEGEPRPTWPLRPGLHAAGFAVDSIESTLDSIRPEALRSVGPIVEPTGDHSAGSRAVAIETVGGVRLELWQP